MRRSNAQKNGPKTGHRQLPLTSTALMPTSITAAPGFSQSALTNSALPIAAITISARRVCSAGFGVREWTTVTVALSFCSRGERDYLKNETYEWERDPRVGVMLRTEDKTSSRNRHQNLPFGSRTADEIKRRRKEVGFFVQAAATNVVLFGSKRRVCFIIYTRNVTERGGNKYIENQRFQRADLGWGAQSGMTVGECFQLKLHGSRHRYLVDPEGLQPNNPNSYVPTKQDTFERQQCFPPGAPISSYL